MQLTVNALLTGTTSYVIAFISTINLFCSTFVKEIKSFMKRFAEGKCKLLKM